MEWAEAYDWSGTLGRLTVAEHPLVDLNGEDLAAPLCARGKPNERNVLEPFVGSRLTKG